MKGLETRQGEIFTVNPQVFIDIIPGGLVIDTRAGTEQENFEKAVGLGPVEYGDWDENFPRINFESDGKQE